MFIDDLKFVGYRKFVQISKNFKLSISNSTYILNISFYRLTTVHKDRNT